MLRSRKRHPEPFDTGPRRRVPVTRLTLILRLFGRGRTPMTEHATFVPAPGWVIPFAAMLLAIAVLPLLAPRLWESNLRKLGVGAVLGLPVLFLYARHDPAALWHTAGDYLSFMALLASLFVI